MERPRQRITAYTDNGSKRYSWAATGTLSPEATASTSLGNLWFWPTASATAPDDEDDDPYASEWAQREDVRLQSGRTQEKRPENIRPYPNNRGVP